MPKKYTALWVVLKYPSTSNALSVLMSVIAKSESQIVQFNLQSLSNFKMVLIDIRGLWNQIAIVELQLNEFHSNEMLECSYGRHENNTGENELAYEFELIVFNKNYALHSVLSFFNESASIIECSSKQFIARHTNENMQIIKLILGINGTESITFLRDRFSDFCDEHNFDAVLEPIKY